MTFGLIENTFMNAKFSYILLENVTEIMIESIEVNLTYFVMLISIETN